MNKQEFDEVKGFSYSEYCDYLRDKYGMPKANYCTEAFSPINTIKRTSEGLFIHHTKENVAANLSNKQTMPLFPYEFQKKEHLVYCDYLEHLLLHIMIAEECQDLDKTDDKQLGAGGCVNYLMPILNDVYSGRRGGLPWQTNCFEAVRADKDVYLECIKRYSEWWHNSALKSLHPDYRMLLNMCRSEGGMHHADWNALNDFPLFFEISYIFDDADPAYDGGQEQKKKLNFIVRSILGPQEYQEYWTYSDIKDGKYRCCYNDLRELVKNFYKKKRPDAKNRAVSKIMSYLEENGIPYDSASLASALEGN